jgi:DNA-binding transcriptional ArsR family regulator
MDEIFKALASTVRRRILALLQEGPLSVGEIGQRFDMTLPSLSKHLSVLKHAGLVHERKQGQFVIYSLATEHLANSIYGFLSPFCPDAREVQRTRRLAQRQKPDPET